MSLTLLKFRRVFLFMDLAALLLLSPGRPGLRCTLVRLVILLNKQIFRLLLSQLGANHSSLKAKTPQHLV